VSNTPYYHIVSRCVRRAFLCGEDKLTGKSYEHRRPWIEDRIRVLSTLFAIDICAYAVMSNHYHLVIKLVPENAEDWSDEEVLNRWCALFKGPLLVQHHRAGVALSLAETDRLDAIIAVYRQRLASLSWFMKCLNEPIARKANAEDQCSGHFWEARFSSYALPTERALLTCIAYVDLNPIRSRMANSPEQSDYTSICQRITGNHDVKKAVKSMLGTNDLHAFDFPIKPLCAFADDPAAMHVLPIRWRDYLALVDASGRIVQYKKRGSIDPSIQPILKTLQLTEDQWLEACTTFACRHRRAVTKAA